MKKLQLTLVLLSFISGLFSQNNAQFVSQSVPTTVEAGEIFDISISFKNTGTTTWSNEDNYFLGSQNPQDNSIWGPGTGRFSLPFNIHPEQTVTINTTLTAPSTPGVYNLQRQMLQEWVGWFGDFSTNVTINVTSSTSTSLINFTNIPLDKQLLGRNTSTNKGTATIAGEVDNNVVDYDQIDVELYRNGVLNNTFSQALTYSGSIANFNFDIDIEAELADYTFKIYGKQGVNSTLEKTISDVVAGDVFIIQGQSNAEAMMRLESTTASANESEFIRVYASGTSSPSTLYNDNKWYIAQGDGYNDTHGNTGQWGIKVARMLMDSLNIPIAIFNGAHGGKEIAFFQRPISYQTSLDSNYARLYYRINKAGLKDYIRAVLWSQGESDAQYQVSTSEYVNYFNTLKNDWLQDYPNIEHFYIFQIKSGCGIDLSDIMNIREAQRLLAQNNTDISIMQTASIVHLSDGCHYPYVDGYEIFANRLFPLIYRDIYNVTSTTDVDVPMILDAALINSTTLEIETSANNLELNGFNSDDFINLFFIDPADESDQSINQSITNVQTSGNKIIITSTGFPTSSFNVSYLAENSETGNFITNDNGIELICFNKYPIEGANSAMFISKSIPSSVSPNETFTVSLTYKNTGNATWSIDEQYKLGSQSPQDNVIWGTNRVDVSSLVAPNQEVTFTFNLTAPATEGIYSFQWKMLQEGVEWFGEKSDLFAISVVDNPTVVDPSTLNNKVMFGYQGWFTAPNDGANTNPWHHYFSGGDNQIPVDDFWPDVSEFDEDELFDTGLLLPDGSAAKVPSAYTMKTVKRHMKWLADYQLDGVFLQRFVNELEDPRYLDFRNQVLVNVALGCQDYGRTFAVMYDISSGADVNRFERIKSDWMALVDFNMISNPNYLNHNGLPVVSIWGIGFNHHGYTYTAAEAADLIDFFQNNPNPIYRATVMGGVPTYWRERSHDSETEAAWQDVYESLDIISPWTVNRYTNNTEVDDFRTNLLNPDKTYIDQLNTNGNDISYLPVVWPGFSWGNLQISHGETPIYNEVPRNNGEFFWKQAYNVIDEGINMLYIAMFDEIDEGTAMFKCATTQAEVPNPNQFSGGQQFISLDEDGENLDSDYYLRLASCTAKILRGEEPLTVDVPVCEVTIDTLRASRINGSPYPVSQIPDMLYVVDMEYYNADQRLATITLQGMLAKTKPMIYCWTSAGYGKWIEDFDNNYNVLIDSTYWHDFNGLITHFRSSIDGYFLCNLDDASTNVAISACGTHTDKIAVTSNVEPLMVSLEIPLEYDVTPHNEQWLFDNFSDLFSTKIVSYQDHSKSTFLGDYSIFSGAFQFFADINDQLTTDAFARMDDNSIMLGWGNDERYTVEKASAHSISVNPSDWSRNISVMSNFEAVTEQHTHSTELIDEDDVHTVCFLMTDGDNINWMLHEFAEPTNDNWYGSSERGQVDIGWTITPALSELAPTIMKYVYDSASNTSTAQDYFVASSSGIGYMYPNLYPALDTSASLLNEYMGKADLNILNVIGTNYNSNDMLPFLQQENIDAIFYYDMMTSYALLDGAMYWVNNKPVIGARYNLWELPDHSHPYGFETVESLAEKLNDASTNAYSVDGYSLIDVHAWSHTVADINELAALLDDDVIIVTPDEFVKRIQNKMGVSTSQNKINNNLDISISPNPSTGIFNISYNQEFKNANIVVFDICGAQVFSGQLESNTIDLSNLIDGVYILNITSENMNRNFKIIKK